MLFDAGQTTSTAPGRPQALFEKYRPRTWQAVIGQDAAIRRVRMIAAREGIGAHAWWIEGQSGTGKTTIAYLIAREIAAPWSIEELDAGTLTPGRLEDIERTWRAYGLPDGEGRVGRAYIINEAHGLSQRTARALNVLLEQDRFPGHVTMIFTATCEGMEMFEDGTECAPLLSRCVPVKLARRDLAQAFAARAKEIAEAEGLGGAPAEKYLRAAKDYRNNMRRLLMEVSAGVFMQ